MGINYSASDLKECLINLGVGKGDNIFVQSGLSKIGIFGTEKQRLGLDVMLATFLDVIGPSGTITVPTFNFGFCHGEIFDIVETPSIEMGVFSEFVRCHPLASRSRHPFHSVASIGPLASQIADGQGYSQFSVGSSFDILLNNTCKVIFLGIDFSATFGHIAEERAQVPYRYWKKITGSYRDQSGAVFEMVVNYYARRIESVNPPVINPDVLKNYLDIKGKISKLSLGQGMVSVCSGLEMVKLLTDKYLIEPYFALDNSEKIK